MIDQLQGVDLIPTSIWYLRVDMSIYLSNCSFMGECIGRTTMWSLCVL